MTPVASFVSLKNIDFRGCVMQMHKCLNGLRYACVEMLFASSVVKVSMLSSYSKKQENSFYIPKTHQSLLSVTLKNKHA